jgi:hypothetical protein
MDCAEAYDAAAAAAQGGYVAAGAFLPATLSPLCTPPGGLPYGGPGAPYGGPGAPMLAGLPPMSPGMPVPMLYGCGPPGAEGPYGEYYHMLSSGGPPGAMPMYMPGYPPLPMPDAAGMQPLSPQQQVRAHTALRCVRAAMHC